MERRITRMWIHPVKSCRGVAVPSAELDALGLVGDRRFLAVDAAGRALTQRAHPAMARITPALAEGALTLSADGHGSVSVATAPDPGAPLVSVTVWSDEGLAAEDCGADAAAWFSDVLQFPTRLVRIGPAFHRPVKHRPDDAVTFADAYPLLVITEASLDLLNDRLQAQGAPPVPMERFRPNLVVGGAAAHEEDQWTSLAVGAVRLAPTTRCARCVMITNDPWTGQRGPEPLRTLASYRRDPLKPQDVTFGRNLVALDQQGTLRVGDPVVVGR